MVETIANMGLPKVTHSLIEHLVFGVAGVLEVNHGLSLVGLNESVAEWLDCFYGTRMNKGFQMHF